MFIQESGLAWATYKFYHGLLILSLPDSWCGINLRLWKENRITNIYVYDTAIIVTITLHYKYFATFLFPAFFAVIYKQNKKHLVQIVFYVCWTISK